MIRALVLSLALGLAPVSAVAQSDRNVIEVQPLDGPEQAPSDPNGIFTEGDGQPGTYTPQIDQEYLDEYDDGIRLTQPDAAPQITRGEIAAEGGVVRALDTMSGRTADLTLRPGELLDFGRLTIQMSECRYPAENPEGDAFAFLTVLEEGDANPSFAGWMVASSPALNAMDHPRYDVWVLRCITPEDEGTEDAAGN